MPPPQRRLGLLEAACAYVMFWVFPVLSTRHGSVFHLGFALFSGLMHAVTCCPAGRVRAGHMHTVTADTGISSGYCPVYNTKRLGKTPLHVL